jgi:hypothetical protein
MRNDINITYMHSSTTKTGRHDIAEISTTKTGRHDIAEILLKVALNTINQSINHQILQLS